MGKNQYEVRYVCGLAKDHPLEIDVFMRDHFTSREFKTVVSSLYNLVDDEHVSVIALVYCKGIRIMWLWGIQGDNKVHIHAGNGFNAIYDCRIMPGHFDDSEYIDEITANGDCERCTFGCSGECHLQCTHNY